MEILNFSKARHKSIYAHNQYSNPSQPCTKNRSGKTTRGVVVMRPAAKARKAKPYTAPLF